MKFSCGRCGKRYATAETPAPGRVYKIKCKACGDLIVVKSDGAHPGEEELGPVAMMDLASEQSASGPDARSVTFELGVPEQHLETPHPVRFESPPPLPLPEPVLEDLPVSAQTDRAQATGTAAALSAVGLHAALAEHPPDLAGATTSPGYVDLFSDPARGDDEESAPARGQASTDPFLAAARASLPDDHGASAGGRAQQDVFRAPERQQLAVPAPAAKLPVIAKPPQQKRTGPLVLIGLGALVVVGILAFVLLGGQPPAAPPPQVAAAPPPVVVAPPPPPAAAAAQVVPATGVAEPAPAAPTPAAPQVVTRPEPAEPRRPEKRAIATAGAREERRARDRAAAAPREPRDLGAVEREPAATREAGARDDREAQERERIAREARAREERDAQERERADQAREEQQQIAAAGLGEPTEALTQDQVQKVLSSSRKAFDACIASAGKSSAVALDGRRVMLRLNIQPTGLVSYPTLDDVTLNGTDLGSCLKTAARVMVFPKFKGDPMHVELPLVLAAPAR